MVIQNNISHISLHPLGLDVQNLTADAAQIIGVWLPKSHPTKRIHGSMCSLMSKNKSWRIRGPPQKFPFLAVRTVELCFRDTILELCRFQLTTKIAS